MSSGFFYEINEQALNVHYGQNLTFYPHFHKNLEFFYNLSGQTKVVIEDQEKVLGAGEVAFIWPNYVHSYAAYPENSYYIGIIDVSVINEYAPIFSKNDCLDPFIPPSCVHPDVLRCLDCLTSPPAMSTPLRHFYLGIVLGRLLETLPLGKSNHAIGHDALRNLMRYIDTHITEPISLDRLSKELFMNKYYISKLLSQRIGCSLRTYINAIRVSMACAMLSDPAVTIPRILESCGFESERTFYRAFQSYCGMTPKDYRAHAPQGAQVFPKGRLPGIAYGAKKINEKRTVQQAYADNSISS